MTTSSNANAIVAEMVDLDKLPNTLRLLCRVLGTVKAFELSRLRGGVPLWIPKLASEDHFLVRVIGMDGLEALVAELPGHIIDVPKYDRVAIQLRHLQVVELGKSMGPTETALVTGYSKRQVVNIRRDSDAAKEAARTQPDLFSDGPVDRIDDDHRTVAVEQSGGAHNPFGIGKPIR